MNWLLTLLVGNVSENCHVVGGYFQFRNDWFPWWAFALVLVAAMAFVVLLYFRERARLSWFPRLLGAGLRTVAILFLLLLLRGPVLVAELHCERPREVVVLIDNSLSMTLKDQRVSPRDRLRVAIAQDRLPPDADVNQSIGGVLGDASAEQVTRAELVRAVLANPRMKILERLAVHGPIRPVLFGDQPRPVSNETGGREVTGDKPERIQQRLLTVLADDAQPKPFQETQTALADSVNALLTPRHGEGLPAAIVVVTDGRDNASQATLQQVSRDAAAAGVPLHIYGVGSSESGNLQLKELVAADTLFTEDTASVAVRWRAQGFSQGRAEIVLKLGDQEVARKEVAVRDGDDFREVLTFTTPKPEGDKKLDLTASLRYLGPGEEALIDDNLAARSVRVIDRKVRVLFVEGQPRWEYKFLMQNLLRDRRVQASLLPVFGDPKALQSGKPYLPNFPTKREELFNFDLLVIGDVPGSYFSNEQQEWVRDFVNEGGGLVVIAGQQYAPTSWHGGPLADVLPVEFSPDSRPAVDPTSRTVAYQPVLTPEGKRREVMWLADTPEENVKTWGELPGFYWHFPVTKLKPGAEALLEHPTEKAADRPMPLISWHFFGKGRVLFMGVDEAWRWRFNSGEKYIARFWGQVVYQMGMPHLVGNPKRVQLTLEKNESVIGQPTRLYARVLDSEFRPLTAPTVNARVERLDGKPGERTIQLSAVPGQPGEYRADLTNGELGRFVIKTEEPEGTSLEYSVIRPPHHELAVAGLAEEALRRMAEDSGGQFYREEDLQRLPADVKQQTVAERHQRDIPLTRKTDPGESDWRFWVLLSVFVGIVTAEWLLRKFSNLS